MSPIVCGHALRRKPCSCWCLTAVFVPHSVPHTHTHTPIDASLPHTPLGASHTLTHHCAILRSPTTIAPSVDLLMNTIVPCCSSLLGPQAHCHNSKGWKEPPDDSIALHCCARNLVLGQRQANIAGGHLLVYRPAEEQARSQYRATAGKPCACNQCHPREEKDLPEVQHLFGHAWEQLKEASKLVVRLVAAVVAGANVKGEVSGPQVVPVSFTSTDTDYCRPTFCAVHSTQLGQMDRGT
jgi:hypothetical protein